MPDSRLDGYLANYTPFNDWLIARRYEYLAQFFTGTSCLELGSAEGSGTPFLLNHFEQVTIVDGSFEAVDTVVRTLDNPRLTAVHAFFEDLDLGDARFDTVVLAHILEHVDDPCRLLRMARSLVANEGVIIVDVPNGDSLHRQVGVHMGMLTHNIQLNEADHSIGHQRVYTPHAFRSELERAGLTVSSTGGMFIKVVSNAQTEAIFDRDQLDALFAVGVSNPDIAAEIYAVCR